MSKTISQDPIDVKVILDPRLDASEKPYVTMKSAAQTTWKEFTANGSGTSQSSVTFDCPPPNRETFIDRCVFIEMNGTLKITHPNENSVPDNAFALRHLPLQNAIINNVQLSINETNFSINSSRLLDPLSRYDSFKEGAKSWSMTPWYPDNCSDYDDLFNKNSSPLGTYEDGIQGSLEPRGGFVGLELLGTQNAGAADAYSVYSWSVREPLFISPLCHGSGDDDLGLVGVDKFQVTLNYQNPLTRLASVNTSQFAGAPAVTVAVNAQADATVTGTVSSPTLSFKYYTPRPDYKIPKSVNYSYFNLNEYANSLSSAVAGNTEADFNTNSIQISGYPDTVYVWCRPIDADRSFDKPDFYGVIKSLRVNFQNKSGELTGANDYDIFNMSSRNGYESSWNVWNRNGSVVAISLKNGDLGLSDPDSAPGVLRSQQIQIRGRMLNPSSDAVNYEVVVCFAQPGMFTIGERGSYTSLFVVPEKGVLQSKVEPGDAMIAQEMKDNRGLGGEGKGSVFSKLAKGAKSAVKFLDSNTGRRAAKVAGDIGRLVPLVGDATVDLIEDLGPGALKLAKHLVGSGKASDYDHAYRMMVHGGGVLGAGVLGAGPLTESRARSIIASISKAKQGGARASRSRLQSRLR